MKNIYALILGTLLLGMISPKAQAQLAASITSTTNINCFGACTGSTTVTPSGGTAPYTYSWSPGGATTATVSGLCAGTYTVTVTDALAANVTQNSTITQPSAITVNPGQVNVACHSASTGSASAAPLGGTPAYTYYWSGASIGTGQGTANAGGLAAGGYTLTVTDNNGCTKNQTYIITQPGNPDVLTPSVGNETCGGGNDGSGYVTASGNAPFTYNWTPSGGTGAGATSLFAGTYTCTVTDNYNCVTPVVMTVTQPPAVTPTVTSYTNVLCNGAATGAISVSTTGGTGLSIPYTYTWNSGQTTSNATNLPAGTYTCTVSDSVGCTATATQTITQPAVLNVALSGANASCSVCDGSEIASVTGGTAPYLYSWSPGGQTTSTTNALCAGTYSCHVTDSYGCTQVGNFTITQVASPYLQGTVTAPISGAINSGMVYLVKYDTALHHRQVFQDSTALTTGGMYSFSNEPAGQYLVYAVADTAIYHNTFKTYSGHTTEWDSANIQNLVCPSNDTANVNMFELNPTVGAGSISGYVKQGMGYTPRYIGTDPGTLAPGDPVPGLDVNLEQHPGGIIAHTTTDGTGKYHFGTLPPGTFQVFVDIPGLGMTGTYTRTITSNQMFPNLDYHVDSTHIYPDSSVITGMATQQQAVKSLSLSPNPFKDQVIINYNLGNRSEVSMQLYDVLGKEVGLLMSSRQEAGSHSYTFSAADYGLAPGIYILKVTMEGTTTSRKIVHTE